MLSACLVNDKNPLSSIDKVLPFRYKIDSNKSWSGIFLLRVKWLCLMMRQSDMNLSEIISAISLASRSALNLTTRP